MSYRITITGKDTYTLIELNGAIPVEKIMAIQTFLYRDPQFIHNPRSVWDFTECTIDAEMEKVMAFAQQILTERQFATPGKAAFITTDERFYEVSAPLIELVGEKKPIQFQGFPTLLNAVTWIQSSQ